nr:guanylate kinase [Thermoflexales bacterium]
AQRPGEVDGKDYFFVTREEFDDLIEADELLEHSLVYGEYKGIPKEQVRKALSTGKNVVMRIDVQGAAKIKRIVPQAVTIFLMPESEEELIRRLTERKTETPEGLQRRISTAREEMGRLHEFDFVVVNRAYQMNDAAADIDGIMRAERCRVGRQPIRI